MRSHQALITEAELLASSPERVYQWLEARSAIEDRYSNEVDQEIEQALLGRSDPLIDLGLARYSKYGATVRTLFARTCSTDPQTSHLYALRLASLSNESLAGWFDGVPDVFFDSKTNSRQEWLSSADQSELIALFQNPKINQSFLTDFLQGKEAWQALDEPRRLTAIQAIAHNKRMRTLYSREMDGFAEFLHDSVFFAAWSLTTTLPTTPSWANALGGLLENLPRKAHGLKDPLAIAARWQAPADDERGQKDETDIAKIGYPGSYQLVRKALAQLASSQDAKLKPQILASADPAFRAAAYSTIPLTPEQILSAYELDKNLAVNSCLANDHLWLDPDRRQALHDICWKACDYNGSRMDTANAYNYFKEDQLAKHPSWFKDEEDPIDPASAPATKADMESLMEASQGNDYLARENMLLLAPLSQTINAISKRLSWVWWLSLVALGASLWRHL